MALLRAGQMLDNTLFYIPGMALRITYRGTRQERRKAAGGGGKVHPLPRPMLVLCRSIFCGRFVPIGAISSVQQLQSVDRCATAHKVYRVVVLEVQNGKASLTSASRHLFAEHRTKRWMGYSS